MSHKKTMSSKSNSSSWELQTSDEEYGKSDFRLVELNADVEKCIQENQRLYFCGTIQQGAVLCTENKSYTVVCENTSNTSILFPHIFHQEKENQEEQLQGTIVGSTTSFYKLREKKTDRSRVKDELQQNLYDPFAAAAPATESTRGYSLAALAHQFQTSHGEMQQILTEIGAVCLHQDETVEEKQQQKWTLLHPTLIDRVFSIVLDLIIENDWPILDSNVTLEQFATQDTDVPKIVIQRCLEIHSIRAQSEFHSDSYRLNPVSIARFRASEILAATATDRSIPLADFIQSWSIRLPEGIEPMDSYLRGIGFISNASTRTIAYFPEESLSLDLATRFEQLFAFATEWELEQLKPYLAKFIHPEQPHTIETVLDKYTVQKNNSSSYCAKR